MHSASPQPPVVSPAAHLVHFTAPILCVKARRADVTRSRAGLRGRSPLLARHAAGLVGVDCGVEPVVQLVSAQRTRPAVEHGVVRRRVGLYAFVDQDLQGRGGTSRRRRGRPRPWPSRRCTTSSGRPCSRRRPRHSIVRPSKPSSRQGRRAGTRRSSCWPRTSPADTRPRSSTPARSSSNDPAGRCSTRTRRGARRRRRHRTCPASCPERSGGPNVYNSWPSSWMSSLVEVPLDTKLP